MAGDVPETVTCEICGTTFDPDDSRGWCPNTDCGAWQHPAYRDGGDAGGSDGSEVDAPTKTCPNCGKEVRADANFCKFCANEFEEDTDQTQPTDPGSPPDRGAVLDECPDCGADLSRIPSDRLSDCPICGTDLSEVLAESDEPSVRPADLLACPDCEADLTTIPPEMRLVCPDCHVSLEDAIAEDADAAHTYARVDVLTGIADAYREQLAEAGVETVGDLVRAGSGPLAEATDIGESRLAEWIAQAPIDSDDVGTTPAGTDDAAPGTAGADDPAAVPREGTETPGTPSTGGGGTETDPASGDTADSTGTSSAGGDTTGGSGTPAAASGDDEGVDVTPADGVPSSTGETGGSDVDVDLEPDDTEDLEMETQIQPPTPTVVFEVMGREIHVEDGDTIGREIRTAMVEGGAPEDDAVYVHREHARLELVGGECYLTRLGENSLKVNDKRVGEHERVKVEDGDEVSFSEVVTATVRIG